MSYLVASFSAASRSVKTFGSSPVGFPDRSRLNVRAAALEHPPADDAHTGVVRRLQLDVELPTIAADTTAVAEVRCPVEPGHVRAEQKDSGLRVRRGR